MADQTEVKLPESLEVVAYLVTGLASGEPSICFEDERGDYGSEDHTPVFEALVPLSALKARDAEIERLRGVVVETRRVLEQENRKGVFSAIRDTIWRGPAETLFDYLDAAIDQARAEGGEKANG